MRYETLAAIGSSAIGDGYFREAVTSMAASVERFHEAFIRAVFKSGKLNEVETSKAWKLVAAQSERQLGLFVGCHASAFSRAPDPFPPVQVTFRNTVTHKGHIPSRTEAVAYAQCCVDYLRPLIKSVYDLPNGAWSELIMEDHSSACQRAIEATGKRPITLYAPSILSDPASEETIDDFLRRTTQMSV